MAKSVKNQKEDIKLDDNAGFFSKWGKERSAGKQFNKLKKEVLNLEEVLDL